MSNFSPSTNPKKVRYFVCCPSLPLVHKNRLVCCVSPELYMEGVQEFNLSFRESSARVKPKKNKKQKVTFEMHLVDRPWSSGMYQIQQQWGNYPFDRNFIWNNQHPNSALPIYIESTPKAEGFKQTNRSNMHQQTHTYKHTAGTNREHIQWDWCRQSPSECRRITVHQFTKKNKTKRKNDQHDDFRDVFTLRFDSLHFSKVPANRNPSQDPSLGQR